MTSGSIGVRDATWIGQRERTIIREVAECLPRPDGFSSWHSFWSSAQDFHRDRDARPNLAALQRNMDQLKDLGVLKAKIDVKRYADLRFIDAAAKTSSK